MGQVDFGIQRSLDTEVSASFSSWNTTETALSVFDKLHLELLLVLPTREFANKIKFLTQPC